MKERIKQLKHQASLWCDMNIPDQFGEYGYGEAWEDKFAELIVAECMNKIEQAGTYFNTQPQYTDAQNKLVDEGFTWGVESCQVMVKQHFGVE